MNLIEWGDHLVLGLKIIDDQHKRLIELINELDAACLSDNDTKYAKDILSEFIEYTLFHFKTEEDLIESHKYNTATSHYHEHTKYLEIIPILRNILKNGDISAIKEYLNIVRPLLYYHITHGDRNLVEFLLSK